MEWNKTLLISTVLFTALILQFSSAQVNPNGTTSGRGMIEGGVNYSTSFTNNNGISLLRTVWIGYLPFGLAFSPNGKYAYVTDYIPNYTDGGVEVNNQTVAAGRIYVINTSTYKVVNTIDGMASPEDVAITPDGKWAYVANYDTGSVGVVNLSSWSVTTNITLGPYPLTYGPFGLVVSPNGAYAYVTDTGSSSVSVIDTTNNSVLGTIRVGQAPSDVGFTPNGQYAWVANLLNSSVSVINTTNLKIVHNVSTGKFSEPQSAIIAPNGTVAYVIDYYHSNISEYSALNYSFIRNIHLDGRGLQDITISPDGKYLYVVALNSSQVFVVNTTTNRPIAAISIAPGPVTVTLNPSDTQAWIVGIGLIIQVEQSRPPA